MIDRLNGLIKEKEITAIQFANDVGVSKNAVSEWKTGRIKPSIDVIIRRWYFVEFAQRFSQLLDAKKITAYKLSMDTEISNQNISVWKSGKSVPSLDLLIKLADYFECSIDYLVERPEIKERG